MSKGMKEVNANICQCLICDCPYCNKEHIEVGTDVMDITGWDFEEENEIECNYCGNYFIAKVGDDS